MTTHNDADPNIQIDFSKLINDLDDSICYRDLEGALVLWNEAFGKSIRASLGREPFVGMKTVDYLSPEQKENFTEHRKLFQQALAGTACSTDFSYTFPTGSVQHFEISWSPTFAEGKVDGVIEFIRNITDRKETELKFRESEANFRSLVENANEAVLVTQDERIQFCNSKFLEWTGYSEEEVLNTNYIEFAYHEDRDLALQNYRERITGDKKEARYPIRVNGKEGMFWVLVNSSQIEWQGQPAILTLLADISELKSAADLNARYRSFVENSTEAIYSVDFDKPIAVDLSDNEYLDQAYLQGYINNVNDAYARIAGLESGESMNGMRLSELMPRSVPANVETILEFKRHGFKALDLETEEFYGNGAKRFVLNNLNGVIEDGLLQRVWCVSRDVTKQRYLEADLRELAGRLISNQEKELSHLARELHDNLTQKIAVLAIEAGIIQNQADISESVSGKIESFKNQLISLSQEIHSLSRDMHPSIINDIGLEQAIQSECNNFSSRRGVPVIFEANDIPKDLPANISLMLYRIIQEALKNIADHAHSKNAYVFLEQQEDNLVLMVRDAGCGFNSVKVKHETGLGLSSMRERARLIGGKFSITSREGKGTSVEVIVPLDNSSNRDDVI